MKTVAWRWFVASVMGVVGGTAGAAGPDIMHTNLQDASHFGPIGGIHAYAWGSWTCNVGTLSLSWVNNGTPALAMNAYRLHDGRLVQIGLGNCKHACCVANGTGCGLTCSSSGFGLRPGCRDIYGSGFNSGQSRLGPRSGINAYRGTFSTIPSGSGDALWRRCQVREDDMRATTYPGALYFAEGIYVCLEEQQGEHFNNATYRRMTVANTGGAPTYVWSVADQSQAGRAAIYAWKDHGLGQNIADAAVKVVVADVPNEGRYIAASKASDRGNGTWRYDYAVYNIDSDRAGGSLSVPLDASATVTQPFFSSPFYHSGEPYSNAPWITVRANGRYEWRSPQTFAENRNSNALRWGTMYTFSFTANRAPTTGSATLTLFKPTDTANPPIPASPDSIAIPGLDVPTTACAADFNNDGNLDPDDLSEYVTCYFTGVLNPGVCDTGDFNGDGNFNPDDLSDYVTAFFAGC